MSDDRIEIRTFRTQGDETVVVVQDDKRGMYFRADDKGSKSELRAWTAIAAADALWHDDHDAYFTCRVANEMEAGSLVVHQLTERIAVWRKP